MLSFSILCLASLVATAPVNTPQKRASSSSDMPQPFIDRLVNFITSPTRDASISLKELLPVSKTLSQWTTLAGGPAALPFDDTTFRATHIADGLSPIYAAAPDGRQSFKAHYPQGSYKPSAEPRGGFSFYAPGPASVDLSTAKEAVFGYSILFPEGFEWNRGGKLPGLCTLSITRGLNAIY